MIRIALPTGDLRGETGALLADAGIGIEAYGAGSRELRFSMPAAEDATARVFREKDIPVQVALGNYDIGVCGIGWVEELTQRFPSHEILRVRDLRFGKHELWLAAAAGAQQTQNPVRIVSEFGNIAESIARRLRIPRYRVFPVWGAAEAYPPEDADVALVSAADAKAVAEHGLRPLARVLESSTWLIANKRSLASKDLSAVLAPLLAAHPDTSATPRIRVPAELGLRTGAPPAPRTRLRLALPDGHAQSHTSAALEAAGVRLFGYGDNAVLRRPEIDAANVDLKVIRPQDMPQQVAIGQFDLAITGRDWLFDHLVQFPSSPVEEIIDLRRSIYGLAAIAKDVDAVSVAGALEEWRRRSDAPIRVASEYPNIADHFARERHFGRYSIIPIAGASEGFVPDDAEILIEGIDTGASIRANKLTVLERFFESTNCVIANKRRPVGALSAAFDALVEQLRLGAGELIPAGGGR